MVESLHNITDIMYKVCSIGVVLSLPINLYLMWQNDNLEQQKLARIRFIQIATGYILLWLSHNYLSPLTRR